MHDAVLQIDLPRRRTVFHVHFEPRRVQRVNGLFLGLSDQVRMMIVPGFTYL